MDTAQRPIVVGIDGSAASLAGVKVAAREAALRGLPLRVVHADSWHAHPAWVDTDPSGPLAVDLRADPEQIVKEGVEYAISVAATPVGGEVIPGEPGPVLTAESRTATMVVVSHRGAGGFLGLRLGSVAIAVAAHARCPVLVIRGTPVRDGYVVVGVDGSLNNRAAVGYAFAEAALRGARLLALHSWLGPASLSPGDMLPLVYDPTVIREQEADRLAAALREWSGRYPLVSVEHELVRARATSALVTASERAQLVVVGTRGHGHRPVLPFGSVTHALLHHAACPMLVVPPPS